VKRFVGFVFCVQCIAMAFCVSLSTIFAKKKLKKKEKKIKENEKKSISLRITK
jgi:Na+-driven multidrug efflux pump